MARSPFLLLQTVPRLASVFAACSQAGMLAGAVAGLGLGSSPGAIHLLF